MSLRVLVTGGAGFIGSHLVDRLVEMEYHVSVVDNLSNGDKKRLNKKAAFYKIDLQSKNLAKVLRNEKPEVILHLAAQTDVLRSLTDPCWDAQKNIVGALNLFNTALEQGSRRVIFASSGRAVYGQQEMFPAPEHHPLRPLSPYGVGKLAIEHYLYYFQQHSGLDYAILRYADVYGPRQGTMGEGGIVAAFIQTLLEGEPLMLKGNGMHTYDFVYVEDAVDATLALLSYPHMEVFHVSSGIETSANDLLKMLKNLSGVEVKEQYGPERKGVPLRHCFDNQKAARLLEWSPRVPLEEGLKATLHDFQTRKK